ncbi:MAG: hypothetical protein EX285_08580, partial [Thaumarchaeota archaeon]|nr:hypothetical protein [Nitrososphaerota archaeon]
MKYSSLHIIAFLALTMLFSCQADLLEEKEYFSRLYKAQFDIEAVDFVPKPDGDGYYILGNSVDNTLTSNLIIFNADASGYTKSTSVIETSADDRGKKLFIHNNSLLVLGERQTEDFSSSILFQTDLSGNPQLLNDSTVAIRELFYDEAGITSLIMEDLFVQNDNILLSGYIENSAGRTNKISRVYNLSNLLNLNEEPEVLNQIPIDGLINFDGSKSSEILTSENRNSIYIIGQTYRGNETNQKLNISIDQINSLSGKEPAISPALNNNQNQIITAACLGNYEGDLFFGGHLEKTGSQDPDSLFVLKCLYFEQSADDAFDITIQSNKGLINYGNTLTDIIQASNGEVLAVVNEPVFDENDQEIGRKSSILKFSFFVDKDPKSELIFEYKG